MRRKTRKRLEAESAERIRIAEQQQEKLLIEIENRVLSYVHSEINVPEVWKQEFMRLHPEADELFFSKMYEVRVENILRIKYIKSYLKLNESERKWSNVIPKFKPRSNWCGTGRENYTPQQERESERELRKSNIKNEKTHRIWALQLQADLEVSLETIDPYYYQLLEGIIKIEEGRNIYSSVYNSLFWAIMVDSDDNSYLHNYNLVESFEQLFNKHTKHSALVYSEFVEKAAVIYNTEIPENRKKNVFDRWYAELKSKIDKVAFYEERIRKETQERAERYRIRLKERLENEPLYRMKQKMRGLIYRAFKFGYDEFSLAYAILGCSYKDFINHITTHENWRPGMTIENHGAETWHLDHVKPLKLAKTIEFVIMYNYHVNIQPLFAWENLEKSAKYDKNENVGIKFFDELENAELEYMEQLYRCEHNTS